MGSPQSSNGYVEKVEHLLPLKDSSASSDPDERCLVALVLLSNPTLIPNDQFQKLLNSRKNQLDVFCQRLLASSHSEGPTTTTTYARLVTLLLGRILSLQQVEHNFDLKAISRKLLIITLDCLCSLRSHNGPEATKLAADILDALTTYFSIRRSQADHDEIKEILEKYLLPLWEIYAFEMRVTLKSALAEENDHLSTDNQLMETTLSAIVDLTEGGRTDESQQNNKEHLHKAMETLYRNEVLAIVNQPTENLPSCISDWLSKCLSWLSNKALQSTDDLYSLKGLPKDIQLSWQETFLLFVRCLAFQPALKNIIDKLSNHVVRLILLHVVSPSPREHSGTLRLLAWTACAAWADRLQGYDWMLNVEEEEETNKKTTTLGSASHLCALMRLASGEWRIQLGYRLVEPNRSNATSVEGPAQQERNGIVNGCAQVLASLVDYLGQIADDMESLPGRNKRTLTPEALLHLHESLKDTLQATSSYLCQLSSNSFTSIDAEDSVMMQLLGTLLSEFDVFDGLTNLDTNEIMKALHFSMIRGQGLNTREQMISCLTQIFVSARGDTYRVLLLKEYGLVGDSMASFLCSYWSEIIDARDNVQSIPIACHLAEVWLFIITEYSSELRLSVNTSEIRAALITWMRHGLRTCQSIATRQDFVAALDACVACFVTLQGDTAPSKNDRIVLQEVMQLGT